MEVELLTGCGVFIHYQNLSNSECQENKPKESDYVG